MLNENDNSKEGIAEAADNAKNLQPPFHERIYTIKEVADIFGLSDNHDEDV